MRIKLKQKRVATKMNKREFADYIGVGRDTYSGIEEGRLLGTLSTWLLIQKGLHIPNVEMFSIMKEGLEEKFTDATDE